MTELKSAFQRKSEQNAQSQLSIKHLKTEIDTQHISVDSPQKRNDTTRGRIDILEQ